MGDLSDREREALMDACPLAITPTIEDHADLFAVVERIKTQAAVEALRTAATDLYFAAAAGPTEARYSVMQRLRSWADRIEAGGLSDAGGRVEP